MRRALLALAVVAPACTLVACGDDDDAAGGAAGASGSRDAVTIEHVHGTAQITGTPERIVALTMADADTAAALGVPPVMVPQATGIPDGEYPPWFDEARDGADVEISAIPFQAQQGPMPYEQIAAARPDLILGMGTNMDAGAYDRLSGIAPTIAPQVGDYLDPWPDVTRTIGAALGQDQEAERLISDAQDAITEAAAEHPEFEGHTFVVSLLFAPDQFGVVAEPEENTVAMMSALGFTMSPDVAELEPNVGAAAELSRERVSLLEADVTLVYAPTPELADQYLSDPLVQRLDVVQQGRLIEVEPEVWNAFRNPSVLSIPYSVEHIVPILAEMDWG